MLKAHKNCWWTPKKGRVILDQQLPFERMPRERECERESCENEKPFKKQDHETWIKVSRKKPRNRLPPPPLALKTIFISLLPVDTLASDIKNMFNKFGEISDIIIPSIQKTNPKYRYAFIKYKTHKSQTDAIAAMDGLKLEGRILKVQPAKVDKPSFSLTTPPNLKPPTKKIINHPPKPAFRDHRSYVEVSTTKIPTQSISQSKPERITHNHPPKISLSQ